MMTAANKRDILYLPGIFFISSASLGFEIVLTRLFTVAVGYPFAYMVISLALLGYGAAGAFLRLMPGLARQRLHVLLLLGPALFATSLLTGYALVNRLPFDPVQIVWDRKQLAYLLLMMLLLFMPFFFAGLTLAASFVARDHEIGRCYFSDLSGAGLGCLLPVILFSLGWDERMLLLLAAVGWLSLLCFGLALRSRWLYAAPPAVLACVLAIILAPGLFAVRISPYRDLMVALRHDQARIQQTTWSAVARVDIVESPAVRFAPGLSLNYRKPLPGQIGLTVDGDSLQAMTAVESGKMGFIEHLPSSLAYRIASPEQVFIYNFGGGLDILAARHFGVAQIDASEQNSGIISAYRAFYADQPDTGLPANVNLINADGRRWLKTRVQAYDLIVLPLSGTPGSGTGLFATGEDYRLTKEAVRGYYDSLRPGGFLSFSRYLQPVPSEAIKFPLTLIEALEHEVDLQERLVAIRSWSTWTVLLKKGALQPEELAAMRRFCSDNGFDLVYYPGITAAEANQYNRFAEPIYYRIWQSLLDAAARPQFVDAYLLHVAPATDDAPFYHNYFTWNRLGQLFQATPGSWRMLIQGGFMLPIVLIQSVFLSFILILLPAWIKRRDSQPKLARKARAASLVYFLLIGMGYMLFEITLISRMVALFDTTTLSMTVVLVSLLLSSGLGSLWLNKRLDRIRLPHRLIPLLIAILLFAYALILPALLRQIQPWPLPARVLSVPLLLGPAGFLMGMPFPMGLRLVGRADRTFIPWAWCANSCASVVSASLAVVLAISRGYLRVTFMAGFAYFLAAGCLALFHHFMASPVIGTKATLPR